MEQNKTEIEFTQRVYMLMTEIDSISKSINDTLSEEDKSGKYSKALMKSKLARETLKGFMWDIYLVAHVLRNYVDYEDECQVRFLEEICKRDVTGETDPLRDLSFYTRELNKLALAVLTLWKLLRNVFEHYFYFLGETTIRGLTQRDVGASLRILDNRIEDTYFWLDAILNDVGNIINANPTEELATKKCASTSYINELRRQRLQQKK